VARPTLESAALTVSGLSADNTPDLQQAALKLLMRGRYDAGVWRAAEPHLLNLLEQRNKAADRSGLIQMLARSPLPSVREALRAIAGNPSDPDFQTARECLAELGENRFANLLIEDLGGGNPDLAAYGLAKSPLGKMRIRTPMLEARVGGLNLDDPEESSAYVWGSIALAKKGRFKYLNNVFRQLDAGWEPSLFWGSPYTVHDNVRVAALGSERLLDYAKSKYRRLSPMERQLIKDDEALGQPKLNMLNALMEEPSAETVAEPPAVPPLPDDVAGLFSDDVIRDAVGANLRSAVSRAVYADVVPNVLKDLTAALPKLGDRLTSDYLPMTIGNELIDLASRLPAYQPDAPAVIRAYSDYLHKGGGRSPDFEHQLGWILAQGDFDSALEECGLLLRSDDVLEKSVAWSLTSKASAFRRGHAPPFYGAGGSGGPVEYAIDTAPYGEELEEALAGTTVVGKPALVTMGVDDPVDDEELLELVEMEVKNLDMDPGTGDWDEDLDNTALPDEEEESMEAAAPEDAGREDSGREDSGREDSGWEGSGSEDGGSEDGGSEDSGSEDSGWEDSAAAEGEDIAAMRPDPATAGDNGADPPRKAYALLDCPDEVEPLVEFRVVVGLSKHPTPGVSGGPLRRPDSSTGSYTLTVKLLYDGFMLRSGEQSKVTLQVTADDPYPQAHLHMTAVAAPQFKSLRTLLAEYSIDGQLIGSAARAIVVSDSPAAGVSANVTRGFDLSMPPGVPTPDMTISIVKGNTVGDDRLVWSVLSPHGGIDLTPPANDDDLKSDIGSAPDEWARSLMNAINASPADRPLGPMLRGRGVEIRRKIPVWVRRKLKDLAELFAVSGRGSATVFVVSDEPNVPWELAYLKLGGSEAEENFLGAEFVVGRWIRGYEDVNGDRVPAYPPPTEHAIDSMAVVSGDYSRTKNWEALKGAEEEASELASVYRAESVNADGKLATWLTESANVAAIHFAVHGKWSVGSGQDGIVLIDGTMLTPTEVLGARLDHRPFVFLNACQLGQGEQTLGDYGGMAAAFLEAGASGVIAALWNVNDTEAKKLALDFYAQAGSGTVLPGALFREQRGEFEKNTQSKLSLAYQFFGHPHMRLKLNV